MKGSAPLFFIYTETYVNICVEKVQNLLFLFPVVNDSLLNGKKTELNQGLRSNLTYLSMVGAAVFGHSTLSVHEEAVSAAFL